MKIAFEPDPELAKELGLDVFDLEIVFEPDDDDGENIYGS